MAKDETHEISIARLFEAPRELVYRAFVDPDQLCQWFGPAGLSVPCETVQIDARPGGFQRFVMIRDENPALRSTVDVTFSQVIENELLAGHQDVQGPAGGAGPARFRLRLEFHDHAGGTTRLELRQGPFTEQMASDTVAGWESSFIKLDSLLRRSL
jgi:uncharacterized protein YndB with AHSA1/START domain